MEKKNIKTKKETRKKSHKHSLENNLFIYLRLIYYIYNSFWWRLIRMRTVYYYILYICCIIIIIWYYGIQYYMFSTFCHVYNNNMKHCIILWPAYKKQLPVITRPNTLYIIIIIIIIIVSRLVHTHTLKRVCSSAAPGSRIQLYMLLLLLYVYGTSRFDSGPKKKKNHLTVSGGAIRPIFDRAAAGHDDFESTPTG